MPSRGCSGRELAESEIWWNGPHFLKETNDKWPEDPQPTSKDDEHAYTEVIKNPAPITHSLAGVSLNDNHPIHLEKIIDHEKYSTKIKLLRVTAQVFRFVKKLRKQPCTTSPEISADELIEAEKSWIQSIQSTEFAKELECIRTGRTNLRVQQLGLFLDDDKIIRCEGRIDHATVPNSTKQPILLPPRHGFTKLIIRESHEIVHHDGIRETLNCVRGKYWVLRGRECVKGVVRRCVKCKKFEAKPFPTPKEAALPPSRVSEDPPFTNTPALTLLALYMPLTIKKWERSISVCSHAPLLELFTLNLFVVCQYRRFLQAFRRFVSRRGLPSRLITDNAFNNA